MVGDFENSSKAGTKIALFQNKACGLEQVHPGDLLAHEQLSLPLLLDDCMSLFLMLMGGESWRAGNREIL